MSYVVLSNGKNPAIFSLDFFIMYLFCGSYKSYSTGSWGGACLKSQTFLSENRKSAFGLV